MEDKKWKGVKASVNGPSIFHLFFTDDLMLFCKAKEKCCKTVMDILNDFCKVSGLRVNFSKSKLYASPNTPSSEVNKFKIICGMTISKNLGIYLGAPIVHGRVKKSDFNFVIEKVQRKLAGWKAKSLTFAGRATIVQSVSSTILYYNMATTALPQKVCNQIDKLNWDFLWGSTEEKMRTHLVKWEKVCRPKKFGGLSLHTCNNNNEATLAKLGWNLVFEKDSLWKKVLKNKYNIPTNP